MKQKMKQRKVVDCNFKNVKLGHASEIVHAIYKKYNVKWYKTLIWMYRATGTVGNKLWFVYGNHGTYFGCPLTQRSNNIK